MALVLSLHRGRMGWSVVTFTSWQLCKMERNDKNYSAFKLDLLALKWAVTEKFEDHLLYSSFVVVKDHNPLRYLEC